MANLKFSIKEIITLSTVLVVVGSAWATSQADIRSVAHSAKENSTEMNKIEARLNLEMTRMERRLNKRLDRNYYLSKKIRSEAN